MMTAIKKWWAADREKSRQYKLRKEELAKLKIDAAKYLGMSTTSFYIYGINFTNMKQIRLLLDDTLLDKKELLYKKIKFMNILMPLPISHNKLG